MSTTDGLRPPEGRHELLTPGQVARWMSVHVNTVYRWLNSGDLPGFRTGRTWRVSRDQVLDMMRQGVPEVADDDGE